MSNKTFLPRSEIGRTGFAGTILGIGDLADRRLPIDELVRTVHRALDAGLNVIDTAPSYEDGYSEQIVGQAIRGRREGLFVIDKIDHHDDPVAEQIEGSLKRLQLDHTDLFVFHGLSTMDGWKKAIAPGGAMEQLEKCVKAGKTQFRGISCHNPEVLREAIPSGLCDVVMFPVGAYVHHGFVEESLPLAKKHRVGTVCFKTFGAGKLVGDTSGYNQPLKERPRGKVSSGGGVESQPILPHLTVEECVHYTLTLDPDVALLGLSFSNEQDAAFAAAKSFKPLSSSQMADMRRRAVLAIADKGKNWWNPGGV